MPSSDPVRPSLADVTDKEAKGIPTQDQYVARYCELTGRSGLPELDYYFAYNAFRLAGILQGIVGRVRDGTASNAAAAQNEARVAPLAQFAYACAQRAGMEG
jgi:aminoglycoside phosphotransferase (APT) family kinase protein